MQWRRIRGNHGGSGGVPPVAAQHGHCAGDEQDDKAVGNDTTIAEALR
jgi:hypothetical protein